MTAFEEFALHERIELGLRHIGEVYGLWLQKIRMHPPELAVLQHEPETFGFKAHKRTPGKLPASRDQGWRRPRHPS